MQTAMMGGYNKAVVAFPHHNGTYDSPNPPLSIFLLFSHGGAGGCWCGQSPEGWAFHGIKFGDVARLLVLRLYDILISGCKVFVFII